MSKKMKKIIALVLSIAIMATLLTCLIACDSDESAGSSSLTPVAKSDIKVGLICLHDTQSTYDKNFIDAMNDARAQLGLGAAQVIIKTNISESSACYDAAADLVDQGCDIVFADSFGHEDYILRAAREFPNVQFCHATGTQAHTAGVANFHNAFASIYEGRYLAGVAAGMKLNEIITNRGLRPDQGDEVKMGYVGAWPYAEVISGYTSFYLGAKSVCPYVTMEVKYTNSWYDETKESQTATALIEDGCLLISQHADSWGAPTACENAGIPNVSYNGSTIENCPNTFIVSSRINWTPYYVYAINCVIEGKAIATDYTGTIATGSVVLTDINATAAAEGTVQAVNAAKQGLIDGTTKVFDTSRFTVKGATLTSYLADVNSDAAYTPDTEVIVNGAFEESKFRSAPYFDIIIDGISVR